MGFKRDKSHTSSSPTTPFMGGVTSTATFVLLGMFLSAWGKKNKRKMVNRVKGSCSQGQNNFKLEVLF